MFLPLLRANVDRSKSQLLLLLAFVIGMCTYAYVAIVGDYGIINRVPPYKLSHTVMEYFYSNKWQPFFLEVIYLLHLYTVWRERSKINKYS
jgi:hypothetical protein